MELLRTSLKTYSAKRCGTGAPRSQGSVSRVTPCDSCHSQTVKDAPVCSTVQHTQQINFDDLCKIYPCHEPSRHGDVPQQNDDEGSDSEQSEVDLATKIDRLCTADIVKILLQPTVLDTVVTELVNSFLSE